MDSSQKIIFAPFLFFHFSVCLSTKIALSLYETIKSKTVHYLPFLTVLQNQSSWDDLKNAKTIQEWELASLKLDIINDHEKWKVNPISPYYDDNLIALRLDHIRHIAESNDIATLMQVIRAALIRNLAGIDNPHLYSKFYIGTKALIEEYIDEVAKQLTWIADFGTPEQQNSIKWIASENASAHDFAPTKSSSSLVHATPALSPQAKYEYFAESLRSFGRSALLLSGGMSLGLYHLGVARALYQKNVMPSIICGSSVGGALVAAIICSMTRDELNTFFKDPASNINFGAFERVGSRGALKRKLFRFLKHGHLVNIQVLQEFVRSNLGNVTFAEVYEKSHRVLNIFVTSSRKNELPALLNYLTAPDVVIWSAVCASGTGLGLYDPVSLLFKAPNGDLQPWNPQEMDWAVAKDESELPLSRLSELFNVNNVIISKIVPYKFPIVDYFMPTTPVPSSASFITKVCGFLINEVRHRLYQLSHLGMLPDSCVDIFRSFAHTQEALDSVVYISPNIEINDAMNIISNPSSELTSQWILKGERAAWPQLSRLQIRLKLEITLEAILERLKKNSPELAPIYEMLMNSTFKDGRPSHDFADHFGLGSATGRRKRTKSMY